MMYVCTGRTGVLLKYLQQQYEILKAAANKGNPNAVRAIDRIMLAADLEYPQYGFAGHKGYHAASHVAALKTHGPCPIHRMSWAPIRALG